MQHHNEAMKQTFDVSLWNTGVGQLRVYLREFRAIENHINLQRAFRELKHLLLALNLHCSKTWLELKHIVLKQIKQPAETLKQGLLDLIPSLKEELKQVVEDNLEKHEKNWSNAANNTFNSKYKIIHAMSFRRICAREGMIHKAPSSEVSWDLGEDICEAMVASSEAYDQFPKIMQRMKAKLSNAVDNALSETKRIMQSTLK